MTTLFALDQSGRDRLALDHAEHLAVAGDSSLVLLHVVSLPKSLIPGSVREAEDYLAVVTASLAERGVAATHAVVRGDAAESIVKYAEDIDADTIVLTSRGRKGWDKLVLGSVAEAVLATSTRPVTIINESTNRMQLDEEIRLKSYYMAATIWHKRAAQELTDAEAGEMIESLAARGLDRDTLIATYRALEQEGSTSAWLDLKFQVDTLRTYLPSALSGVIPTEPVASAA